MPNQPQTMPNRLSDEQRRQLHAAFNEWMQTCSEEDHSKLLVDLREQIAPGQICSIVSLIQACFARQSLLQELPASLVQLLRARNWQPVFSFSTSSAG